MKPHFIRALAVMCIGALLLSACSGTAAEPPPTTVSPDTTAEPTVPAGRFYIYEKEGFGGTFGITLYENGRFSYYEGMLSSHLGFGTWVLEGDILTLTEDDRIFRFLWCEDELHFLADGSHNFIYVRVPDGGVFRYLDTAKMDETDTGMTVYVSP